MLLLVSSAPTLPFCGVLFQFPARKACGRRCVERLAVSSRLRGCYGLLPGYACWRRLNICRIWIDRFHPISVAVGNIVLPVGVMGSPGGILPSVEHAVRYRRGIESGYQAANDQEGQLQGRFLSVFRAASSVCFCMGAMLWSIVCNKIEAFVCNLLLSQDQVVMGGRLPAR